jgi:glycosyltransferase involved in cell wall biosynthesis/CDP-glycerol glycerophosphotransferase (TagB/SpsB family)
MTPAVTVVIPAFNAASTLARAVRSVLNQSLDHVELVIVDDGSIDETVQVAERFSRQHHQVTVLRLDENTGAAGAPRNAGLRAANGRYVMFLDSDDELPPRACEMLLRAAEETGADITAGRALRVDLRDRREPTLWMPELYAQEMVVTGLRDMPELLHDPIATNKLFRREFLEEYELRFAEGVFYEDLLFTTQAYFFADGIALLPRVVYRWLYDDEAVDLSITNRTGELRNLRDRLEIQRRIDAFLLTCGAPELKTEKDVKFLTHDLRIYVKPLRERSAEYQAEFMRTVADYLAGIDDEAYARCDPMERARAFLIVQRDLAGVLTTADFIQRKSVISTDPVERDGRIFWTGRHLERPDAERFLDVTELGLHWLPFDELGLYNQITSFTIRGGVIEFTGAINNFLGRIRPEDDLQLQVLVRDRATKQRHHTRIKKVEVDGDRLHYRAQVDLADAIREIPDRKRVWNVFVVVTWQGKRCWTSLAMHRLDEAAGRIGLRGGDIEWYTTISGNLALRALTERQDRPATVPRWLWWQGYDGSPAEVTPSPPVVTLVLAARNVEHQVADALGSVAAQSVFAATQVVLIDDGSTDGTATILREFAGRHPHVELIEQEHRGSGAARNAGLARAAAPYVAFLDPTDVLAEGALERLVTAADRVDADVVVGNRSGFPRPEPSTPYKRCFGRGNRIVEDLTRFPDLLHASFVGGKLFRAEFVRELGLSFGPETGAAEIWFSVAAMIKAERIFVLDRPVVFRRIGEDGSALVDAPWHRAESHRDHLLMHRHLLELAGTDDADTERLVQRFIVRSYQPFLLRARDVFTDAELKDAFPDLCELYGAIPDDVILEQVKQRRSQVLHYAAKSKSLAIFLDPDEAALSRPVARVDDRGIFRTFEGADDSCALIRVDKPVAFLEAMRIIGTKLVFEGCWALPGLDLGTRLENRLELVITGRSGDDRIPLEPVYRRDLWHARGERDLYAGWQGAVEAADLAVKRGAVALRVHDGDRFVDIPVQARLSLHRFKGVWRVAGRRITLLINAEQQVGIRTLAGTPGAGLGSAIRRISRETSWIMRRRRGWKDRLAYWATYPLLHRKDIWIIGERFDTAQDNSHHLFRYIRQQHPDRDVFYVIDAGAKDWTKVEPLGNVLARGSFGHRTRLLHAKKLINSYDPESYAIPPGHTRLTYLHSFGDLARYRRVFLQHGVIYNDVTRQVPSQTTNHDLVVASAGAERDYLASEMGFGDRVTALGLPRFDALTRTPGQPTVLLMPTWRRDIVAPSYNPKLKPKLRFGDSAYFRFFQSLLTDRRLLDVLAAHGVRLEFYPHYEIQPHVQHFTLDEDVISVSRSAERGVQDALRECSLLVTDYSSVFFDAAYMGTPLVYVPFDEEDFYSRHYRRGYFELERDGFGPVARTVDDAVDEIIAAVRRGFTVESPYRERAAEFFAHRDRANCRRVFEEIDRL